MAEAVEMLKRDTRRYAKRQMTWFKRDKNIIWIKNTDLALAEKKIKEFLNTPLFKEGNKGRSIDPNPTLPLKREGTNDLDQLLRP